MVTSTTTATPSCRPSGIGPPSTAVTAAPSTGSFVRQTGRRPDRRHADEDHGAGGYRAGGWAVDRDGGRHARAGDAHERDARLEPGGGQDYSRRRAGDLGRPTDRGVCRGPTNLPGMRRTAPTQGAAPDRGALALRDAPPRQPAPVDLPLSAVGYTAQ